MAVEKNKEEALLPIGTTLANGKYRIERYLASGGFGKTYEATDTAFDEKVAIKELYIKGVCGRVGDSNEVSISLTENQRTFSMQQDKFRKEARRLRKLSNSHIVHVHDLFDENNTSYYVMDFVEGESLSERQKRTKAPMSESEVMLILPQMLDALATVHDEGIWHLDLKPGNIMLDKKGNVQLIDFGASKQLRNKDGDSLSTSSALAYTPGYAPSEQMEQNMEKFGAWTDIYALGATLYHLLTRNQPPSPSDIDEDADAALPFPKSVSKKTRDLIMWMMKPNRKMRPQSIADVKQFLVEDSDPTSIASDKTKKKGEVEDDDTVIKSSNKEATEKSDTPKNKFKPNKKLYIGILVAVALGTGIIGILHYTANTDEVVAQSDTIQDEDTTPFPRYVNSSYIDLNKLWPSNHKHGKDTYKMFEYEYSGNLDPYTGIPNGEGYAEFTDGRTYQGSFVDGICEGENAVFRFPNGDMFEGKMKNNQFVEGTYYIKNDGSCFEGTFKNGQPDKGKWREGVKAPSSAPKPQKRNTSMMDLEKQEIDSRASKDREIKTLDSNIR